MIVYFFHSGLFKQMKFLEYLKPTYQKSSEVLLRSHRDSFCKYLTPEELEELQNHQKLYSKVLDELGGQGEGVKDMALRFKHFVENNPTELLKVSDIFVKPEKVEAPDRKDFLFDPAAWAKPSWTYKGNTPEITTPHNDLGGILSKLSSKQNTTMFVDISKGLKDQTNPTLLGEEVLAHYLKGIRDSSLTVWDRFFDTIISVADFLKDTITLKEMALLLEYCIHNEKFIFILLYPYLFLPLKKLLWTYLFPIFSLRIESFTFFLKHVALEIGNIIKHQNVLVNGFRHLSVSRSVRFTLGTGGVSSLLLLFHSYFLKDNRAVAPLYVGMGGVLGDVAQSFRLESSKLVFELTKTASTLTNAALAGFLEPKQDAVRQILKNLLKK